MRKGECGRARKRIESKQGLRMIACLALLLAGQMLVRGASFAQEIPPSLYSEMKWRMIGPFRANIHGISRASWWIRETRTLFWLRRSAMAMGRMDARSGF